MHKFKWTWVLAALSLGLAGCAALSSLLGKGGEQGVPRVLVLGVACDSNPGIGNQITDGILANITPKAESFGPHGYELLISSITRKRAGLKPPTGDFIPPYEGDLKPAIQFSSSTFYNDLVKSQYYRTKVSLETGLDYVVTGEAKEKKLGALEEGNLITAESAQIKMLELRTGEFVVTDNFTQGLFEVVAPDRVGVKLASRINKFLSSVRKAEKQEAKAMQKKFNAE